ncbi:EmrB/QacA subfamily drug resistance transporter [Nocardioides thalensis]|uniref:EmrB/QacA subfamily drug resistance transporter n=1 Tax=Nocardioides thalensis TaxID=1914755 RepID=A0A853C0G7_9ACTN|nr:DHA2 family efflux MFS transporter permease subunit [Nocardioides thalensis]NYJ01730.1 EmrB/QacA subfamily drug resistance transporter [Nocardioides thalensis]
MSTSLSTSPAYPPPSRRAWVLALASIASLMVSLDTLVVSTALSTIQADFGATLVELEWTVNAYNLTLAVTLMPAAALGDRFGRRRLFGFGLGLFVLASAACAVVPDASSLIAARAVQGIGAGAVLALALALVSAAYAPDKRGGAIGILEGITGVAVALGPVVGGAIAGGVAWEWIFWMNVPIGVLAIPFVWARIDESRGDDASVDVAGVALVTLGSLGVVWALVRGNGAGWDSVEVTGSLVLGLVALGAFVAWELRASDPMLPMPFFRNRLFAVGNAATFFMFASLFGAVFFLAQFLQVGQGSGPLEAGVKLLPWTATLFFVAPVAGALTDKYGGKALLVGGLLMQAVGMGWFALIASPEVAYGALVPPLIVAGCGVSMAMAPAQSSVMASVSAVGKAAGANSMLRELGGVFGIAVLVAVFAATGSYASPDTFVDGFGPALATTAGLSLAGAICGLWLPRGVFPHPAADEVAGAQLSGVAGPATR